MTLTTGCGASLVAANCRNSVEKGALGLVSEQRPGARLFFVISNLTDPVAISELSFRAGSSELEVKDGKILNNNVQTMLSEYQFGVALVEKSTWKVSLVPGPFINVTVPIKSKEERGLVPMSVKDFVDRSDYAAMGVFILKAKFADGSSWTADLDKIKADVESAASRSTIVANLRFRHAIPATTASVGFRSGKESN